MARALVFQPDSIELEQNKTYQSEELIFDSRVTESGIQIQFNNNEFSIDYTSAIWRRCPSEIQNFLADNLAVATTMHLGMVFPTTRSLVYKSSRPYLEPYFYQNFLADIPSCAEIDEKPIPSEIKRFLQLDFKFHDHVIKQPGLNKLDDPQNALVSMSFGKDSLLTYALASELELDPEIVYIVEQSFTYEKKHKTELGQKFEKEFGKKLHILSHDTGKLRDYNFLGLPKSEYGWGLQNTEYALDLIPYAYALNKKYLLFGNEQSTAETYFDNRYNWKVNTCYDQSPTWSVQLNQMIKTVTSNSVQCGSLIEPLMDLLIQRILVNRYPEYAKYQMSCFSDTESGKQYKWCQNCNVCTTMYLLCEATGVNPKKVGFTKNMLSYEFKNQFGIFDEIENYTNSGLIREELCYSFYLASKNHSNSELVNYFKTSNLYTETKQNEEVYFKKFFTVYPTISTPHELRRELNSIFKEEISKLEI